MAKMYPALNDQHAQFIAQQKIFFVATATADSRVSVSPKGMDTLRIVDANRVAWLNVTGSGNETAAHVQLCPRMTMMFCAFAGDPLILRLYGNVRVIHRNDAQWDAAYALFQPTPGARQIFDLAVDLVQTSCGQAVPHFSYEGERDQLIEWSKKKGEDGIRKYWEDKNQKSIDGIPTHIVAKSL
jgi:hypothetical protein